MKSFCGGEREKLLTPWRYLLLFAVVAVGFYFAQPDRAFVMELATAPTAADTVTARYLDAAVAANPDDRELAIARAKQLLAHGEIESVYSTMEPIAKASDRLGYRARLMVIEAMSSELFDDDRRGDRVVFFERLQSAAGDEWATLEELRRMFELALGHGRPRVAARVAERMARLDVFSRREHLEQAAKWHLAGGDPLATARVLELIAYESDDPDTFREFVIRSIKRRLESGDPRPAMDHALEHAREFPDDAELLNEVMALAKSADRPDVAMEVGRLLVGLALDDPGVVHAQVDREIAAGNLDVALRICGERLDRAPYDVRALQRKAQLLVWTDRAPEALEPWTELIALGVYDDLPRALAVATQIGEDRRLIEILAAARANRPLDRELTLRLAQAHERVGEVDAALEVLRAASEASEADVVIWLELARLEKDLGRLEDSIATRAEIDQRFGLDAPSALAAAKDLVKAGQDETALDLLERYSHQVDDDDTEYWQALAKLAWELEADDSAYQAHVRLWKAGNLERTVLGRLQTLAREGQDLEVALEASWAAWEEYHRPEDLLAALADARQLERWDEVDRGLAEAEARLEQFDGVSEYWVAVALRAADRGDLRGAESGYDRAMAIAPNRDDLRLDFLWLLLDHDRMRRFLGAYRQWESRIRTQPAYWAVAAVGLRRLERHEEARAYLDRHVRRAAHRDLTAVLDYVGYLEQLGFSDSADRLRRHTYAAHARELVERLRTKGDTLPMSPYHEVQLGEWIRGDWGTDAVDGWVDSLARRSEGVGLFHRALIAHYASTDQAEVARARYASRDAKEAHRWQQMSQALLAYDLDATADALESEARHGEGELDRVAEIDALRRLGREEEAYVLSRRSLGESSLEADPANSQLLRFGISTGQELPAASRGRFDRREFGGVSIDTLSADSAWSDDPWSVQVHVRRARRNPDGSDLRLAGRERADRAAVEGEWRARSYRTRLTAGFESDNEATLGWLEAELSDRWANGVVLTYGAAWNRPTSESDILEVSGALDEVRLGASWEFTSREYLSASTAYRRFGSRSREPLGEGVAFEVEAGHRIHLGKRRLGLRLFGTGAVNQLEAQLPDELRDVAPAGAEATRALAEESGLVGVGVRYFHGDPAALSPSDDSVRYGIDAWIGSLVTTGELAYSVRLAAGTRVFGWDELGVEAFYGESNVGGGGLPSQGLALYYVYRFGN